MPLMTGLLAGADADLILHNGKILTVDAKFSIVQAVAIKGGRFVAVGDDRAVLAERGSKTKVVNLRGQTVVPGLMAAGGRWRLGLGGRNGIAGGRGLG